MKVLALGYSACWLPTAYQTTDYCPVSPTIQPTLKQPKCAVLPSTIPNKNAADDDAKSLCFSDPELDAVYSEQILLQWILVMKLWLLTPSKSMCFELALWRTVITDEFAFIVPSIWTRIVLWGWTGNSSVRTERNKKWEKKPKRMLSWKVSVCEKATDKSFFMLDSSHISSQMHYENKGDCSAYIVWTSKCKCQWNLKWTSQQL